MACCDCGAVHSLNFRLVGSMGRRVIQFKAEKDARATGQIRRWMKKTEAQDGR